MFSCDVAAAASDCHKRRKRGLENGCCTGQRLPVHAGEVMGRDSPWKGGRDFGTPDRKVYFCRTLRLNFGLNIFQRIIILNLAKL